MSGTETQEKIAFSVYPSDMDAYFAKNEIMIRILPVNIYPEVERRRKDFRVTSSDQYYKYLDTQIQFWTTEDPSEKMISFSNISKLKFARREFENAKHYYTNGSISAGDNSLKSSLNAVVLGGSLYKDTKLTRELLKNSLEDKSFFEGFFSGLSVKKGATSSSASFMEGVFAAMNFRGTFSVTRKNSEEEEAKLKEVITEATQNYSEFNK